MNKKTIVLFVVLFALIVAGMFMYAQLKKNELQLEVTPSVEPQATDPYAGIVRIDAKHYYNENKHTLVGMIEMPTPCDLVEANAVVAESMPEQVTVDFTVINTAETCAQVLTTQRFRVDFIASEKATINARFMGRPIELNLIPAAQGEVPEDFELFIKG